MAKLDEKEKQELFDSIAKKCLYIDTLKTRGNDALDFKEVSVWSIKRALEMAYEEGLKHALGEDK